VAWISTLFIYAWATVAVFDATDGKFKGRLGLVAVWLISFSVLTYAMLVGECPPTGRSVACLICVALSQVIFWWTRRLHGSQKPLAAWAEQPPARILQSGPYAIVRHPFYSAYLLLFISGALITVYFWTWLCPMTMLMVYFFTAVEEEKQVLRSELESVYIEYRGKTGRFFPKLSQLMHLIEP
jgi:protein-S-isoprenylcysteine O-methyltransferase Ste14